MEIDTSDWQEESKIEGEDPEDTELLREMAAEARDYIEDFEWAPRITSIHLAFGIGGVVAAFLFQFDEVIEDSDDALWVIVGDLPSAYVIVEPEDDGMSALSRYCEMMEDWTINVLEGNSLDDSFPVDVEATAEHAEMLNQRIAFLRTEIIESPED
ncbi:MAG TPA: hypothetical protein VEW08_09435 [Steroidobacteraceae bacterium]|nr:hypothetical protein [Steroidobacteraceae bacterium]